MKQNIIIERLERQWSQRPADEFIIDGYTSYTWPQFKARIEQISALIPPQAGRLGLVMDHGFDMIAALFAAIAQNKAYVPAEKFIPQGRKDFMFAESGVQAVLCDEPLELAYEEIFMPAGDAPRKEAAPTQPAAEAYVLYTSGTSGRPKGVSVRQENILHYADAFEQEFHLTRQDRMLQYSVCSFDIFVEEVFASLLNGAGLVIPPAEIKGDLPALLAYCEAQQVTMISGFPYLISEINKLNILPASLRLLISGGDVVRASYIDQIKDRVMIYNTYGPSETTVCASYYRIDNNPAQPDGTLSIGRPVRNVEILICDDNHQPLPDGQKGEICIIGNGVSSGYINPGVPESANFMTLADGRRMYCSGDLGYYQPDGNLVFCYRKDDQVMIDGRRVEPMEVEALLAAMPGIDWAVVRSFFDENHLSYMAAYLVMSRNDLSISQIKAQLAENLPDFMIPEFFIRLTSVPMTINGKVDTARLPVVLKS